MIGDQQGKLLIEHETQHEDGDADGAQQELGQEIQEEITVDVFHQLVTRSFVACRAGLKGFLCMVLLIRFTRERSLF